MPIYGIFPVSSLGMLDNLAELYTKKKWLEHECPSHREKVSFTGTLRVA
jgi:hypothetical protein